MVHDTRKYIFDCYLKQPQKKKTQINDTKKKNIQIIINNFKYKKVQLLKTTGQLNTYRKSNCKLQFFLKNGKKVVEKFLLLNSKKF